MGRALITEYNGDKYKVERGFFYIVEKYIIKVPQGFITDLASVPRYLWITFPPFGKYTDASIVHDYLYSKDCEYKSVTREQADKIFLELMKQLGVPTWKRYAMYYAVRLFGKSHFRKE